jgi:DNA sulfur modification protein DndD
MSKPVVKLLLTVWTAIVVSISLQVTLTNEMDQLEKDLQRISDELGTVDDKEIRDAREERSNKRRWLQELDSEIAILDHEIEEIRSRNSTLKRNYDMQLAKDKKNRVLRKKIERSNKSIDALKEVKKQLIKDFRLTLQDEVRKIFFSIIWKQDTFEEVGIDEDFRLSIRHKRGYEVLGDLSAGESLFLAISFVTALKRIAGIKLPLIMDSPLGRMDGLPKLLYAKHIPKFSQSLGTQISLLLTGTEYTSPIIDDLKGENLGSFRGSILNHVGKEYHLLYNEKEERTRVIEYGRIQ